ncbi:MAG: hypothetical protein U5L00_21235 [Desulfovermiculus sp.]|nr:hypothetical protein [Desulfovermiculus sp.]
MAAVRFLVVLPRSLLVIAGQSRVKVRLIRDKEGKALIPVPDRGPG